MSPASLFGYVALACSLAVNFWALAITANLVLKDNNLTDRNLTWFCVAVFLTPVNMLFVHTLVGQGAAQ